MTIPSQQFIPPSAQGLMLRNVVGFTEEGLCLVRPDEGTPDALLPCEILHTSGESLLCLATGDRVVVWHPEAKMEKGIVMGRVGESQAAQTEIVPERVVLKAGRELLLSCGESTLLLRGDGKILLRGKNILSQGDETNRVKGGKVSVN